MTSRELETKINFPQQAIFTAGRKLKKLGFINTVNGPFGGYQLARLPEDITVQEILTAFNDAFYLSDEESVKEAPAKETSTVALQNFTKKMMNAKANIDQQMSFTLAELLNEVELSKAV